MTARFDLILRGGMVVTPRRTAVADIGVRNGRIASIGALAAEGAAETLDVRGLHVLPGVIDTQVHFREPGLEYKEDLETGSRAAVLGGVTAVFDMPNTRPPTVSAETLADKMQRAEGRMYCDFAFYVGAAAGNISSLPALERLPGAAGIKVFMGSSTGDLLVDSTEALDQILGRISRRAAFHAEDESRLRERTGLRRPGDPSSHPEWRDAETAFRATQLLVQLAERHRKLVHVLHVSTAEEVAFLARHKAFASVEVTPHHLTLAAPECYHALGTYAQMNPPVRSACHRQALWAAVLNGTVDVIGSDHAPHTRAEKDQSYPASPSGMPGVQTLVPLMLDHVNAGRLSLERLADLTSHGPRRLFGIEGKGGIVPGNDADFTIVDLGREKTISNTWIASRCGWTPYHGRRVRGWPVGTFVRGMRVMWEGEITARPDGLPCRFAIKEEQ